MFNCCNMKTITASGHGASVENFNTTRLFLAPKNRCTVLKLFKNLSEKEINIKAFEDYVKKAHCHWIKAFGNYSMMYLLLSFKGLCFNLSNSLFCL